MRRALCTLFAIAICPALAAAEGLVHELPADGSWVRYHMTLKTAAPVEMESTGTMTIRSVGVETIDGRKHRWIEFAIQAEERGKEIKPVYKLLVREKEITARKPLHIARGWKREPNGDKVTEVTEMERSTELRMLLPGKLKDRETVNEKMTVEYQRGKLEIKSGYAGDLEVDVPGMAGPKMLIHTTIFPHEKVPFGTAAGTIEMTLKMGEMLRPLGTLTLKLDDFGTKAKSDLPDNK